MIAALLAWAALAAAEQHVFLSRVYTIDRIYTSMKGPFTLNKLTLRPAGEPRELVWITGFRTDIVDADGSTPQNKEFMCHINLDMDARAHGQLFRATKAVNERLFTLSQGQFDLLLPPGTGVPVYSDEALTLFTQVLNHNQKTGKFQVRHKVTIEYVRDRLLKKPVKPLFAATAFVMALVEGKDGYFSEDKPDETTKHASCQPGEHAPGAPMGIYQDPYGRKLTGHWVIKPGRETRRTLVTKQMALPFDTTLHYAAVHLHPFAESLELRDLTTGKTVLKARARNPKTGVGLEHVDYVSSEKGIPLFKDHHYELVSVYNNTAGVNHDSMASVFLYLHDKEFKRP